MPKQVGNQKQAFVAIGYFWLIQQTLLYSCLFLLAIKFLGEAVLRLLACCAREQLPPSAPSHATDSPHCCCVAPRVGIASRYDVMQCARASISYVAYCVLKQLLRCIVLSLYAPERQIVDIFTHQTFSAIDYLRKHTYDIGCFNRAA